METFLSSLTFACLIAGQFLAVVYAYQARVRDRNGSGTDAWLGVREPQDHAQPVPSRSPSCWS